MERCPFKFEHLAFENWCKSHILFQTRTTALLHTDLLGVIAPTSSMWSRWSFTSSRRPDGIFLGLTLKGLDPSLRSCVWWSQCIPFLHLLMQRCHGIQPISPELFLCFLLSRTRGLSAPTFQTSKLGVAFFGPPLSSKSSYSTICDHHFGNLISGHHSGHSSPFLITVVWSLVLYSWTVVFWLLQLYMP